MLTDKPLSNKAFAAKVMPDIWHILKSGQTSPFFRSFEGGPYVRAFEKEFTRYVGARYAVSMANGTLALNAAYSILGPWMSDKPFVPEMITTPYTFVATVSEIIRTGNRPIFVDVDEGDFCMDPALASHAITGNTVAIVAMHPLGVPCDMQALMTWCKLGKGKIIIEDACQALGSTYNGKMCGTFGDMGVFSGQQTKSASFGGEGGMIVTDNEDYADKLRHIRNHGSKYSPTKDKYAHIIGTNYRLTEIQAAIGLHSLKAYPKVLDEQRKRARILIDSFLESRMFVAQSTRGNPNRYIIGSRINGSSKTRGKFLKTVKKFNRGLPGYTIGGGYSELVYQLPAFNHGIHDVGLPRCRSAEALLHDAVWFDCRQMPIETVKSLARVVEKFKP